MKKYFLTVVYAIDDKPETVEAILSQRPWQAVAHTDALADLEHAQADLQAATDGYDAARLEIESLQARVQKHVRSGKDWAMRAEALERTITTLRAHIASRNAQVAAAEKAMRELESANSIALQLDARIKELDAQLDAVGAGGVEPLRKRERLHHVAEQAQIDSEVQRDAERYRWLRKQHWNEGVLCVVAQPKKSVKLGCDCPILDRLDGFIDAARAAQGGAA